MVWGCYDSEPFISAYVNTTEDNIVFFQTKSSGLRGLPNFGKVAEVYKNSQKFEREFKAFLQAALKSGLSYLVDFAKFAGSDAAESFRPVPDLHLEFLKNFKNQNEISKFGISIYNGDCSSNSAYSFTQKSLKFECQGKCAANIPAVVLIPDANPPKEFQLAFGCVNNGPFLWAWVNDPEEVGKVISWQNKNVNQGNEIKDQKKICQKIMSDSQATQEAKKKCYGGMKESCGKGLEGACKKSGLLQIIKKSVFTSPLPPACDILKKDYEDVKCFKWFIRMFVKGLVVMVHRFDFLSRFIQDDIEASGSSGSSSSSWRRMLTSEDDGFEINDAAVSQVKELPSDVTQVEESNLVVGGSTPTKAVSTNVVKEAEEKAAEIKVVIGSSNFMTMGISMIIGMMILSFI